MADDPSIQKPTDTTPVGDEPKKQTSRISLDNARPIKSPLEAKKATGPVPGIPTHAGPIPQTIRLKRPPTAPVTVRPIDLPPMAKKAGDTSIVSGPTVERSVTAETVKRQTSRIVLADPTAPKSIVDMKRTTGPVPGIPTHAGPIPQTIRLKRPPTASIVMSPAAITTAPTVAQTPKAGIPPMSEAPTVVKHLVTSKAPTSRIVLDDAAVSPSAATSKQATSQIPPIVPVEPPAPKTIRLKRPATTGDSEEAGVVTDVEPIVQTAKKAETAKIELPVDDTFLTPVTQRKTIKIKRTDHAPAPHGAPTPEQPAAPAAVAAPEPGAPMEIPSLDEEQSLVFPIVAAAATLCVATLVYIMVAQAFGVHLLLPSSMQLH